MHPVDEVPWLEDVGLPGTRAAATHVHPGYRAARRGHDHGHAGQPAVADALMVPYPQAGDSREAVHPSPPVRNSRAASAYTRVQRTISATSTYSSAWWAIHLPPGP